MSDPSHKHGSVQNSDSRPSLASKARLGASHPLLPLLSWSPVLLLTIWCLLMIPAESRAIMLQGFRTNREYTPVELFSGIAFLGASAFGAVVTFRFARTGGAMWQTLYFGLFTLAAAILVLEETQWGQPILGYEIPEWMLENNRQGEFTFHNVGDLQGREDLFFLVFCVPAIMLHLDRFPVLPGWLWQDIRAAAVLKPLLLAIVLLTLAKAFGRVVVLSDSPREVLRWSTEIAELYIALWAMLYVGLKVIRQN